MFVEQWQVLISASIDCSVRIWTQDGKHIGQLVPSPKNLFLNYPMITYSVGSCGMVSALVGTFGQDKPWQLGNNRTYQHPVAPKDVLLDPMTLPAAASSDSTQSTPMHTSLMQARARSLARATSTTGREVDEGVSHYQACICQDTV